MSAIDPPPTLARRFELARTAVSIAGHEYELLRPRNVDDLISEEDFAIDERIPYWAECWPSARAMAERIAALEGRGRSLLELGCGIGLVALAAARAGFEVLATDYYADALEFTAANAERHALAVETRLVDWRRLPDDLGRFDVVTASDVLYEAPQAALVAEVFARTLAKGGLGLVSDPGRRTAPAIEDECASRGLHARVIDHVPMRDANADLTVTVFEIRHANRVAP